MDKNILKNELLKLVFTGKISTKFYGELLNRLSSKRLRNFEILNIINNIKIKG
jgi:hypothetical protein